MSHLSLRIFWAAGLLASAARLAHGDIIELNGGRKITGTISRQGDRMVIRGEDGSTTSVQPAEIARVTLTSDLTPAQAAEAQWTSVSAQIKKADDLATIISLHQQFLVQFPDAPLSPQVRESLGVYQQLAAGDTVKFRGRWMPRNQIDITLKQWTQDSRPAVDLYRAGRLKEALEAAKEILAKDAVNPDALSVAGLVAYRMNNLILARTYFTALAAADPGSVLAENNLGVVSYQQNAAGEGLIHYTRALQAMPGNRMVLDNIAEALNAYAGDKDSTNYRALIRQFEQSEIAVEAEMAKKGLERWGSTWVTREELEQLEKNQRAVKDQMAQLDAQYRAAGNTLADLDAQITQTQGDIEAYTSAINTYSAQILLAQQAIDQAVLMAQRDATVQNLHHSTQWMAQLQSERSELAGTDYVAAADKLKAALAAAQSQYTGVQRIMDLGEAENPPPPVPVAMPANVPSIPPPPIVLNPPPVQPPQPAQTIVTVPVPVYAGPGIPNNGGRNGH